MTSLIEQAAHRLEQLRQAGIEIPPLPSKIQPKEASAEVSSVLAEKAASDRVIAQYVEASPTGGLQAARSAGPRVELDFASLSAANVVVPGAPRSQVADQFRVIKRPLISNAMGKGATKTAHANLIMITSALAGEGKSFTSVNLAMSIATELDNTVMLVDADVARPTLPRMLGMPDGPGLLDLLDGSADMSSVLLKTNVDKLTILRSGTPRDHATEMLASEAMRQLLDDMSRRYPDRIIIFDSPPLLLTTESRTLAMNMGQIVVVVQAGKTLQSDVQAALATIEVCPLKMMLLNQTRADSQSSYGYGYGYGYGHGYGYRT